MTIQRLLLLFHISRWSLSLVLFWRPTTIGKSLSSDLCILFSLSFLPPPLFFPSVAVLWFIFSRTGGFTNSCFSTVFSYPVKFFVSLRAVSDLGPFALGRFGFYTVISFSAWGVCVTRETAVAVLSLVRNDSDASEAVPYPLPGDLACFI